MPCFLTDFGLAKSVVTGSKLTRTGEALGTPAYMSPEQARGDVASLTPATDVWGLGCLLFQAIAGRPPFQGPTPAAIVGQVLLADPPRLGTIRPELPAGLGIVVGVALAKDPAARYASADRLREDLDRVARGEAPRARIRRSGRRRLAVAGAGLLAAGLAVAALGRDRPPPSLPARADTRTEAEVLVEEARALPPSGRARAAELLGRALGEAPGRDDWRFERGLTLWLLWRPAEARGQWRAIPSGSEWEPKARLYLGLESLFRRDGPEALPDLEAAEGLGGPGAPLARTGLAVIRKDWPGARRAFEGAAGWEAALLRGVVEESDPAGDPAAAVRAYGEALEKGIPFAWIFTSRSTLRRRLGDLPGSLADATTAVVGAPAFPDAWLNRGAARSEAGDLNGAIADYSEAIRLDPRLGRAWSNRSHARSNVGDVAGAIADATEAIRLDARHAMAWSHLGDARRQGGDPAGAIADYDRALELDPRLARAWIGRGAARQRSGDLDGSVADCTEAIRLMPDYAVGWSNRAAAHALRADLGAARADYDEALRHDPRMPEALAGRAFVRQRAGDLSGACEDLERALEYAPAAWPHRAESGAHLARLRRATSAR